jgi:hypothetical protein
MKIVAIMNTAIRYVGVLPNVLNSITETRLAHISIEITMV